MGRLAGFSYRDIAKRLGEHGFVFDRTAKGSHEIWWNPLPALPCIWPATRAVTPPDTNLMVDAGITVRMAAQAGLVEGFDAIRRSVSPVS